MNVVYILLALTFPILALAHAGGDGSGVGNGGGASEQAVVYAAQNFRELTEPCWRSATCSLSADESQLLAKIITAPEPGDLRFLSDTEMAGVLFSTAPVAGAEIKIDRDALWIKDETGHLVAYTLNDAVLLLARAMVEHYPQAPAAAREDLPAKLAKFALNAHAVYLAFLSSPNLRVMTLPTSDIDLLLLDDGFDLFVRLDRMIEDQVQCKLVRLRSDELHWNGLILPGSDPIHVTVAGKITWRCAGSAQENHSALSVIVSVLPTEETVAGFWHDFRSPLRAQALEKPVEVILSSVP